MATPYSDIYDIYSGMYSDFEFLLLTPETQENILEGWLISAVGEFDKCKQDLSNRDETLKQFNVDLTDSEIKILAKYMLCEWLSPKLYTVENLKNHLSTKDFNQFSPANLLKEIRETHDKALKSANGAKRTYAHKNFDPNKELHK
jgi:hypothetical protein